MFALNLLFMMWGIYYYYIWLLWIVKWTLSVNMVMFTSSKWDVRHIHQDRIWTQHYLHCHNIGLNHFRANNRRITSLNILFRSATSVHISKYRIGCCFTSQQHWRLYQDKYGLVTGKFTVLSRWETRPSAPGPEIALSLIIVTMTQPVLALS